MTDLLTLLMTTLGVPLLDNSSTGIVGQIQSLSSQFDTATAAVLGMVGTAVLQIVRPTYVTLLLAEALLYLTIPAGDAPSVKKV